MNATTTRRPARTPEASAALWLRIARRAAVRAWPADADAGHLPEVFVAGAAAVAFAFLAAL